jgi:BirA family biotin operon repressor/biotin-[acetyl-CoA-carboxylase] ligase
MSAEIEQVSYIVVGIGVNVNTDEQLFTQELKETATSVRMVTRRTYDRKTLIAAILYQFENIYIEGLCKKTKSKVLDEYKTYCISIGKDVKVHYRDRMLIGKATNITDEGELVVQTPDGCVHTILSGEVSVRGLYGYI